MPGKNVLSRIYYRKTHGYKFHLEKMIKAKKWIKMLLNDGKKSFSSQKIRTFESKKFQQLLKIFLELFCKVIKIF